MHLNGVALDVEDRLPDHGGADASTVPPTIVRLPDLEFVDMRKRVTHYDWIPAAARVAGARLEKLTLSLGVADGNASAALFRNIDAAAPYLPCLQHLAVDAKMCAHNERETTTSRFSMVSHLVRASSLLPRLTHLHLDRPSRDLAACLKLLLPERITLSHYAPVYGLRGDYGVTDTS